MRFGDLPDSRLTVRPLLPNRRIACAAPAYLARAGHPGQPSDLAAHACIVIRESDETYGSWHFQRDGRQETVKVRGMLSTNDGSTATGWALDGHGILLRSSWEIEPLLASGQLQAVLPDWSLPPAAVKLVYPTRDQLSATMRALSDFLADWFRQGVR
ncbi:MAG: HTH-type transcriptional regulator DmlR [Stenotrophomonas maltophilia]|uniref:HTH-type transcriptional regulator DmlR n=1 Tax=Stenotrophomonas maltophilia TaxID=40324 RepID=A0A7V8FJY5_STEMA|nr:MAG: HTH-type transcriptional regulator DmlR [Stenotrophomonas maltophilia]